MTDQQPNVTHTRTHTHNQKASGWALNPMMVRLIVPSSPLPVVGHRAMIRRDELIHNKTKNTQNRDKTSLHQQPPSRRQAEVLREHVGLCD